MFLLACLLVLAGVIGLFPTVRWIVFSLLAAVVLLFPDVLVSLAAVGAAVFALHHLLKGTLAMQLHSYLIDALDRVLSRDLPEDAHAAAVSSEVALLAGNDPEEVDAIDLD